MSQALSVMDRGQSDSGWTPEQVDLLKRTIAVGASDDEFKIFALFCSRTKLDPFAKQIYLVKRNGKMAVQTGIDGYRVIAERSGVYAGSDDAVFDNEQEPNKATVTVHKIVAGMRCAFTATARWDEYCPASGQDFMWKKMPCVMLSKVAEALALRKAFPADLSGLYVKEEMDQAEDAHPSQTAHHKEKKAELPKPVGATRESVGKEIGALVKALHISASEIQEWSTHDFGKQTTELTLEEMIRFRDTLKNEMNKE